MAVAYPNTSCAIVGGGYAGLATLIELRRLGYSGKITLFDHRPAHQKITQWHKLVRGGNATQYEQAFAELAHRFQFEFMHRAVPLEAVLDNPARTLGENYTAIVIAQGSHTPAKPPHVITLDDLRDDQECQKQLCQLHRTRIAVIGGGPTGVQFAFEFAERHNHVILYEARDRLLPLFDYALGAIAQEAAAKAGIDVRCGSEFLYYDGVALTSKKGQREQTDKIEYALFVPGVRSTPALSCDAYGRIEGRSKLYAAGDNSHFSGSGLNTKSAQAAVRKGQHAARTIMADLAGRAPTPYTYAELGYFVSLGAHNAVGYLLSQKTAFSGRVALLMKDLIEKQYDLHLAGLPVYP